MVRLNDTNAYSADSSMLWSNDDRSNSAWRLLHPMQSNSLLYFLNEKYPPFLQILPSHRYTPALCQSFIIAHQWEQKVFAQKTSPSTFNADIVELAGVNLVTNSYREGKTLSDLFLSQRRPKLMKSLSTEKIPKNILLCDYIEEDNSVIFHIIFSSHDQFMLVASSLALLLTRPCV